MKFSRRTLVISDTQFPYAHVDALAFIFALHDELDPDLVVHIGDEADFHQLSFHPKNPNLPGAKEELARLRIPISTLHKKIPEMSLLESNHGSLLYRKAAEHGIPEEMVKTYNDVLQVGPGWKWHSDLVVNTDTGPVLYDHGQKETALRVRNRYGISVVQGHRHQELYIDARATPLGVKFAMQVGCLIDDRSLAFKYNKKDLNRPMLGSGAVINGIPHLFHMGLKKSGRWDKKLVFPCAA